MTDEALEAMDSKKLTIVVPLDLSKAFESTDHRRLLGGNLNALGIGRAVLEWFRSYLTGRQQLRRDWFWDFKPRCDLSWSSTRKIRTHNTGPEGLKWTFSAYRFSFPNTDHVTIPRGFEPLSCSLERPRASMKMSNFERKYSPGYRHMISIVKTKSRSEKGLLASR